MLMKPAKFLDGTDERDEIEARDVSERIYVHTVSLKKSVDPIFNPRRS
jgi:hypothetical protein